MPQQVDSKKPKTETEDKEFIRLITSWSIEFKQPCTHFILQYED